MQQLAHRAIELRVCAAQSKLRRLLPIGRKTHTMVMPHWSGFNFHKSRPLVCSPGDFCKPVASWRRSQVVAIYPLWRPPNCPTGAQSQSQLEAQLGPSTGAPLSGQASGVCERKDVVQLERFCCVSRSLAEQFSWQRSSPSWQAILCLSSAMGNCGCPSSATKELACKENGQYSPKS